MCSKINPYVIREKDNYVLIWVGYIYLEDDHGKVYLSKKGFSAVLQGEKKHKINHIGHFRSKAYKQSGEDIS